MNWPASLTLSTVGSGNIYGQIFVDGATATVGAAPGIQAWVGVNAANTDPATWDASAWTAASFNAQSNANDEYVGTISGASLTPGTYYYAYRWQIGSAAYFYGGIQADGSGAGPWDGTTNGNGVLTVNAAVLRDVTFAVDMGVQAFRGTFTPGTDSVYVVGDVSDWTTGVVMTREGETSVYKATLNLEGTENATRNYKFRSSVSGFEGDLDPGVPGDTTRVLTLGTANVAQTLDTATFNNQTEARKVTFRVDMSIQEQLGNFDPNTGTVKVAGSFNGWTGVALTAQGNGIYAGEIVIDGPISGVTYKFLANDAYESVAVDRTLSTSLLNLTATTLDPVYFSDVSQVGSTFSGAYAGRALTEVAPNGLTYLVNYAFGGSDTTAATLPVQDTSDPTKLKLIVVVRTDDPSVSVGGQTSTSLTGGWSATGVTVADGDNTGLPADRARKVISVDRGTDPKKFIRVSVTK
jgi:hypothetical protein